MQKALTEAARAFQAFEIRLAYQVHPARPVVQLHIGGSARWRELRHTGLLGMHPLRFDMMVGEFKLVYARSARRTAL